MTSALGLSRCEPIPSSGTSLPAFDSRFSIGGVVCGEFFCRALAKSPWSILDALQHLVSLEMEKLPFGFKFLRGKATEVVPSLIGKWLAQVSREIDA